MVEDTVLTVTDQAKKKKKAIDQETCGYSVLNINGNF